MAKESEWETIVPASKAAPTEDTGGWETIVPAKKAKPTTKAVASDDFDFNSQMGAGDDLGSAITSVAGDKSIGSVLEKYPGAPPQVDAELNRQAMLKSGSPESVMFTAGRAKQQADQEIAAYQAKQKAQQDKAKLKRDRLRQSAKNEDYGITDFIKDSGIDLAKAGVGLSEMYVGLLDLTSGGAAGRVLSDYGYNPEASNKFLTGFQSLTRKNAAQNVQEAVGFVNTLKSLVVNPTELIGSIIESLPGSVVAGSAGGVLVRSIAQKAAREAMALQLSGETAKKYITDKVKENVVRIAGVSSGAEGLQTAGSTAEAGRQAGKDYNDYVLPALAAGLGTTAIGIASGKLANKLGIGDLETNIAASTAGVKGVGVGEGPAITKIFKEMFKEGFLEELPQSAQEKIFNNLATGRPWDEGVDKASAQGLMAGLAMAGGHATWTSALQAASEKFKGAAPMAPRTEPALNPQGAQPPAAPPAPPKAPSVTPSGRVEPTLDTTTAATQGERVEPTLDATAAPEPTKDARIAQMGTVIAERLNIPMDQALKLAERRITEMDQAKPEPKSALEPTEVPDVSKWPQPMLEQTLAMQEAKPEPNVPLVEAIKQEIAYREQNKGEPNAARPNAEPDRTSVPVAGEAAPAPSTTGEPKAVERNGVVPAEQNAGEPVTGEATKPTAITEEPTATETPSETAPPAGEAAVQAAPTEIVEAPTTNAPTEGVNLGTETIEAQQTETQGQAESTAARAKRGRPAAAPEVKEAKTQARNEARNTAKRADRQLATLSKTLDEALAPVDESTIESDDQLKDEQDNKAAARRYVLREAITIEAAHRGSAVGKRAKALIARANATAKEIEDIKRGIERSKKALANKDDLLGPTASAITGKNTEVDPAFSKFKSGTQAVNYIIKNGNTLQAAMAKRIINFVRGVSFVVLEKDSPVPDQLQTPRNAEQWEQSRALFIENYKTGKRSIYVRGASFGDSQGANIVTVLHELYHAATNNRIALAQEWILRGINLSSPLVKAYGDLVRTMGAAHKAFNRLGDAGRLPEHLYVLYESTDGKMLTDPREFVAYGLTDSAFIRVLKNIPGLKSGLTAFNEFLVSIRDMLHIPKGESRMFMDLMDATDALIRASTAGETAEGEGLSQQAKQTKKSLQNLSERLAEAENTFEKSDAATIARAMSLWQKSRKDVNLVGDVLKAKLNQIPFALRKVYAKAITMDELVRGTRDDIPSIGDIYRAMQNISGTTNRLYEGAMKQVRAFRKAFKADRELNAKLRKVMYETTHAEVDPSQPLAKERIHEFDVAFQALGPKGQQLYEGLRDYYQDFRDLYISALDDLINNLPNLTEEMKKDLLTQIDKAYAEGKNIEPFFPLVREKGEYWLSVGKGDNMQVQIFKSRADREVEARRLAREAGSDYKDFKKSSTYKEGNSISELRNYTEDVSSLLPEIFKAVDAHAPEAYTNVDMAKIANERLKDDIYEIFLGTMPEQKFRKMFIERKGRAGFSTDIIQNIATTASRLSPALARLQHAQKARNAMSAARDAIKGREQLSPYVDAANERLDAMLSPIKRNWAVAFAGIANKLAYLTYLTSAATAFMQPFSIYFTALTIISVNQKTNPARVAAVLAKNMVYLKQYGRATKNADGTITYVAPSLINSKTLSADEHDAVQAMVDNDISSTFIGEMWDELHGSAIQPEGITAKVGDFVDLVVNAPLRNIERLTRELTYLSSYQIARDKFLSQGMTLDEAKAAAIDAATNDVNESLGDYSEAGRPPFMKQGLGRLTFAMKIFPLVIAQLMIGNFFKMLPFLNKTGKTEALYKFAGIFMTITSLVGIANTFMANALITAFVNGLKDADGDDLPDDLKSADPVTWFKTVFMPNKFGNISLFGVPLDEYLVEGPITALTNKQVGSRLGINDMFRGFTGDGKVHRTTREAVQSYVFDALGGPFGSYGMSISDAVDDFAVGDYQRGVEKIVPSAQVRDLLKAWRYSKEGIVTKTGELIPPEQITMGDIVGQALGFSPADAAKVQQTNFALNTIEQQTLNQRNLIERRIKFAFNTGDEKRMEELIDNEVSKFNDKHPTYGFKAEQLKAMLLDEAHKRAGARAGFVVTKKNAAMVDDAVTHLEEVLARRNKKEEGWETIVPSHSFAVPSSEYVPR